MNATCQCRDHASITTLYFVCSARLSIASGTVILVAYCDVRRSHTDAHESESPALLVLGEAEMRASFTWCNCFVQLTRTHFVSEQSVCSNSMRVSIAFEHCLGLFMLPLHLLRILLGDLFDPLTHCHHSRHFPFAHKKYTATIIGPCCVQCANQRHACSAREVGRPFEICATRFFVEEDFALPDSTTDVLLVDDELREDGVNAQ